MTIREAKKIVKCFDMKKFERTIFIYNGNTFSDKNGNTLFYPCDIVDKAINKLNRLLKKAK